MDRKRIAILTLSIALLMTIYTVPVSAAENTTDALPQAVAAQIFTPQWESTNVVVPLISISGREISVSVVIDPKKPTTSSVGTLKLEKKTGNGWVPIASWPIEATGTVSMTETYNGTAGVTYRTRVVVTTGADEIDVVSTERTV